MHLAALAACWRLGEGLDAAADLEVAGYWCAEQARQDRSAMSPPARRDRHGRDLSLAPVFLADRRPDPVPAVFIDLTAEQRALRDELRGYFAGLVTKAERAELLTERHGAVYRDVVRRMGRGRLARRRLAGRVRRPRVRPDRAADLRQRGRPRRRAPARGDAADRRPDPAGVRHAGAEGLLPAADPGRRRALRDRLHRARRRHRPGVAAHHGASRDGDHYVVNGQKIFTTGGARRRLRLARRAHRPGRPEAQGHLDPDRRHHRPRLLLDADHHLPTARTTSTRPTTTTCGCRSTCWSARRTRAGG